MCQSAPLGAMVVRHYVSEYATMCQSVLCVTVVRHHVSECATRCHYVPEVCHDQSYSPLVRAHLHTDQTSKHDQCVCAYPRTRIDRIDTETQTETRAETETETETKIKTQTETETEVETDTTSNHRRRHRRRHRQRRRRRQRQGQQVISVYACLPVACGR